MQRQKSRDESAKLAVIELAVVALGKLALQDSRTGYLSAQEKIDAHQCLMDALEVLNDERETY